MARYPRRFGGAKAKEPDELKPGQTRIQTVKVGGVRTKIKTRMNAKGEIIVTHEAAGDLEWKLQAEQVKALRRHPAYGHAFLLAGDMNAEKRGPQAQAIAVATGMTKGEPDLRLYFKSKPHGFLVLVENKGKHGRLSREQSDRHDDLQRLGFRVEVLKAAYAADAADEVLSLVDDILLHDVR